MIGGGMTPVLAAGFQNVAQTYDVTVPQVALTTGLYMLGLGIGSVVASPTAILYGKRPGKMRHGHGRRRAGIDKMASIPQCHCSLLCGISLVCLFAQL